MIVCDFNGAARVSGSAGTGKTQVLSARVLRLLLRPNVDPEQILCLTFTKAGAAEMAVREVKPDTVVIRPSIVFGAGDDFLNRFATLASIAPALPLIGGGQTKFQPVYVDDVAEAIAWLSQPGSGSVNGQVLRVCGQALMGA